MGDESPPDHDRFGLGLATRTNLRLMWLRPTLTVRSAPGGKIDRSLGRTSRRLCTGTSC